MDRDRELDLKADADERDAKAEMEAEMEVKTLNVKDSADLKRKVSDVETYGNPDTWQLICKASSKSQDWMKSTKAMSLPHGVLIQVSTQQGGNVAEALAFIPGANIEDFR